MSVQIKHLLIINLLISMHGSRRRSHEKVEGKIARVIQLNHILHLGQRSTTMLLNPYIFQLGPFPKSALLIHT